MLTPTKLNLACGTDVREGWYNLDIVERWPLAPRSCDILWDARNDKIPFESGVVDEVYAGYLLLHLAPSYHAPVLAEIFRVLKPGGSLVVGEVDMLSVLTRWLANPNDSRLSELIWGEQGVRSDVGSKDAPHLADYDKHCQGFTEASLIKALEFSGFKGFSRINVHCADVWYELTISCRK